MHVNGPSGEPSFGGDPGPRRYTGGFSGFHYEAEPCPDARVEDTVKGAAIGGVVGFGAGLLLRCSPAARFLGAALGAGAGALFSKYHLYADWDPDRAREGGGRDGGGSSDAPLPQDEPQAR